MPATEPSPAIEHKATALIGKYSDVVELILPRLVTWALDLAAAIAIIIIGWIAARALAGLTRRLLNKHTHIDATIKPVFVSLVRYAVLIIAFIAAIAEIGIATTSILAVLGAAGLAIGLALQGTLSNVAAGVMLLLLRPLRVSEYIESDGGVVGTVREVGLFSTLLHSPDGLALFVPNAKLWGTTIKNYSRLGRRLLSLDIRIAYEADMDAASKILLAVAKRDFRVLSETEPSIIVSNVADGAITLTLQAWVMASDFAAALSDLRRAVKLALEEAKIAVPIPVRNLYTGPSDGGRAQAGAAGLSDL
ncbi:MAG: mechanosensitive ion channel domain-containing protein [Alphaproteobacteria bacterium]